jgi:transcriptional regulator with XRE-family HTH domain
MSNIIDQLKVARQKRQMKQSELGKKLGMPQSHISTIENSVTNPRLSTVEDMARLLDHELILIPRELVQAVLALLEGRSEANNLRRWMPDEEDHS